MPSTFEDVVEPQLTTAEKTSLSGLRHVCVGSYLPDASQVLLSRSPGSSLLDYQLSNKTGESNMYISPLSEISKAYATTVDVCLCFVDLHWKAELRGREAEHNLV